MRATLLLLCLFTLGCAGQGQALQDASLPAGGAAGGAWLALMAGASSLAVIALSALGAFIASLFDQAAEGQVALALHEIAPFGIWVVVKALFWPIILLAVFLWAVPTPMAFVRVTLRGLGRVLRGSRRELDRGTERPRKSPRPPGEGGEGAGS